MLSAFRKQRGIKMGTMEMNMRKKTGINKGWRFTTDVQKTMPYDAYLRTKTGAQNQAAAVSYDDQKWNVVDLPHDYTVSGNLDPENNDYNGYLKRPDAWYRRYFYLDEKDRDQRLVLHFEGVSGEAKIWVNGCLMKVNYSSYCGFDVEITDVVRFGQEVNVIAIHLDNHNVEGWWYQAGGIYRRVYLISTASDYIKDDEFFVTSSKKENNTWNVAIAAQIAVRDKTEDDFSVEITIVDPEGKEQYSEKKRIELKGREGRLETDCLIKDPVLWDIGKGNLYTCKLELYRADQLRDVLETTFGIREIYFDTEKGFYLNGVHQEIKGLCYHEDEGNLGWAIEKETYKKRIENLIAMGGNAYRCSHNPPDEEVLKLCDEYGVLVMDEVRKFDSGEIGLNELRYMIKRDRNHPSIIMWSMGNEEPWQGEARGARIMQTMRAVVKELDQTRPVTMAMHEGFLEDGAALYSDVIGLNYNHELFDEVHKKYPDKPIIGSENLNLADHFQDGTRKYTGSDLAYETLENAAERPFIAGTFGWAGQDYRGEHRNLSFFTNCCPTGCTGERKDGFYQYAAYWKKESVLHICDHWNDIGKEKREVVIYSNVEQIILYLNGNKVGEGVPNNRNKAVFTLTYQPGTLTAVGLKKNKEVVREEICTTTEPVRFLLNPEKKQIHADGRERVFVKVKAVDKNGNIFPTASESFHVKLEGPGKVLCSDNSDAYSTWWDDPCDMNVYKGEARIVVEAGEQAGVINIHLESDMLDGDSCEIEVLPAESNEMEACCSPYVNEWFVSRVFEERPDPYQWPTDDYYIIWKKYWEPSTLIVEEQTFYHRKGYVICCQEQNMPELRSGKTPALVFERISGKAEFLISARDYDNQIIKRVHEFKESEKAESVRVELPGFTSGDRLIMKVVIEGKKADDGIAGNVRLEL